MASRYKKSRRHGGGAPGGLHPSGVSWMIETNASVLVWGARLCEPQRDRKTWRSLTFSRPPTMNPLRVTDPRSVRKLRPERNLCSHPRHPIPQPRRGGIFRPGNARVPRAGLGVAPKPLSRVKPCATQFSARRRKSHARRVRSPEDFAPTELWPFLIFQLQRCQPCGLSKSNRWLDFRFNMHASHYNVPNVRKELTRCSNDSRDSRKFRHRQRHATDQSCGFYVPAVMEAWKVVEPAFIFASLPQSRAPAMSQAPCKFSHAFRAWDF